MLLHFLLGLSLDQRVFRLVHEGGRFNAQLSVLGILELLAEVLVKGVVVDDLTRDCINIVDLVVLI